MFSHIIRVILGYLGYTLFLVLAARLRLPSAPCHQRQADQIQFHHNSFFEFHFSFPVKFSLIIPKEIPPPAVV